MANEDGRPASQPPVQIQAAPSRVVVHGSTVHMRQIPDSELRELASAGIGMVLPLGLASLCVGVLATILITLSTTPPASDRVFASFVAAAIVCGLGLVFFGGLAVRLYFKLKTRLTEYLSNDKQSA